MNSQGIPLYFVCYYDICLLILLCYSLTINTSFMLLLEFSVLLLLLCQSCIMLDESRWILIWGVGEKTKVADVANVTFITHVI